MLRRTKLLTIVALIVCLLYAPALPAGSTQSSYKNEVKAGVEEVYIFRTIRKQHKSGATPACAAVPFTSTSEDYYDLWSIALGSGDSRVVDTHKHDVGGFTACLGRLVPNQPVQMYATGTVARIPWTGIGECAPQKAQPPVRTVIAFSCTLALSNLPDRYVGGLVVSSTLSVFLGKNQEPSAHVPGYLSTSIVVIRLWKKAAAAGQ
ncbi:MAG TPA: hypothetical protein VHX36_02410 [Candidatus Acidoferrales bacterium]|jgi:hypothetical protein|nr:hypothetical protein [Candidatus Acidoferrales bacterium]